MVFPRRGQNNLSRRERKQRRPSLQVTEPFASRIDRGKNWHPKSNRVLTFPRRRTHFSAFRRRELRQLSQANRLPIFPRELSRSFSAPKILHLKQGTHASVQEDMSCPFRMLSSDPPLTPVCGYRHGRGLIFDTTRRNSITRVAYVELAAQAHFTLTHSKA